MKHSFETGSMSLLNKEKPSSKLFTVEEVADILGVNPKTVHRRIKDKSGPPWKNIGPGGSHRPTIRFSPEDVANWIEERTVQSEENPARAPRIKFNKADLLPIEATFEQAPLSLLSEQGPDLLEQSGLTETEKSVLNSYPDGKSVPEIAGEISVNPATVYNYIKAVFKKAQSEL